MNQEIKKKWVAALRSGDYTQGDGALCRLTPDGAKYCCLGVLVEEVEGEDAWDFRATSQRCTFQENSAVLAGGYLAKTGVGSGYASDLMRMNDLGTSFSEIADYIEENL